MPYTYKKEGDKYVVYKKDGGKRVGATAGNKTALKKYLAALHMHAEAVVKKDDLDKIADYIMSSPEFENKGSSKIKNAIRDMYHEWKAVASNYKNIEEYFEEIEETGGEEAFMENTLTEATGMNVTVSVPNLFVKAFKKFLAESKRDSEKGDTYYEITPGKEAALYSRLFSEWVKINFNALDEYELMDNFDSDLELEDEGGFAAILAKNGLLTKKVK